MMDIPHVRIGKRGIDVRCTAKKDSVTNLAEARKDVVMRHGVDAETSKKLQKVVNRVETQPAGADPGRQAARHRQEPG
jgi:uncharacterized protein YajQ (UPF0234 family)